MGIQYIISSYYCEHTSLHTSKKRKESVIIQPTLRIMDYFDKEREQEKKDDFFEYIIGYNDVKKFLRMSINTEEPVHILLIGPPASAKTMFIRSMMMKLNNSYFTDGGNSTKAGMLEYIFDNKPTYLLIDEIDKMSTKDQTFLLNLMETGIVSQTKHGKSRTEVLKTWVIASSNNTINIVSPLKSRFFIIELEPYSYEQFCQITVSLLTNQHTVKEEILKLQRMRFGIECGLGI